MKRFLTAFALVAVLAVSAIGGDVSTSGSPAPPPSGSTQTSPSTGDIPTDGSADQISGEALSELLALLSFLAV
jgi:hypothetical protein